MNIEHLSHWSGQLNREMYLNRYGHAGIPVVACFIRWKPLTSTKDLV